MAKRNKTQLSQKKTNEDFKLYKDELKEMVELKKEIEILKQSIAKEVKKSPEKVGQAIIEVIRKNKKSRKKAS